MNGHLGGGVKQREKPPKTANIVYDSYGKQKQNLTDCMQLFPEFVGILDSQKANDFFNCASLFGPILKH